MGCEKDEDALIIASPSLRTKRQARHERNTGGPNREKESLW